jgi:5-methylthioadenosine/S-adenosylhomocysteine deaminase
MKAINPLDAKAAEPAIEYLSSALSRRGLLQAALGATLALAASGCARSPESASKTSGAAPGAARDITPNRTLIRKAVVLSLDPAPGAALPQADILIQDGRIAAIGPDLNAAGAESIDASNMIAIPGFVDTHRHMWQGVIRQQFADATLGDYFGQVLASLGPKYRPEDVYIGNRVSALSAIDAGITTILDWSHIQNTPAHTDAAISAHKDCGMRVVFGYGAPQTGATPMAQDTRHRYPADIQRLRKDYFASEDQLLTLALAADGPSFGPIEPALAEWKAAREVGARISVHIMQPETLGKLQQMLRMGLLKDDTTYIHCTNMPEAAWKILRDTGGSVSISSSVEMLMGHGTPAILEAVAHGMRPSLSVDVETTSPNDLFTQMRTVLTLQRSLVHAEVAAGKTAPPALLTAADVLEFATLAGARANGLGAKTGSLSVGKAADIVLLRRDRINVLPMKDPVGAVVLGMDTGNVDSVFVAGRALKRGGQLVGVDMQVVAKQAQASQDYLLGITQ